MEARDHKNLAQVLLALTDIHASRLCKKAFIYGNIEPDKNPATYLHGFTFGMKFHGHNYTNIQPTLQKLFSSLQNKSHFGVQEFYNLGKLSHYMADCFTFPHNELFTGTFSEHVEYESVLHQRMTTLLKKVPLPGSSSYNAALKAQPIPQIETKSRTDSSGGGTVLAKSAAPQQITYEFFEEMHRDYLREAGDQDTDCLYIFRAAACVLAMALGKSTVTEIEWFPQNWSIGFQKEFLLNMNRAQ